jgi:hypothetical protein
VAVGVGVVLGDVVAGVVVRLVGFSVNNRGKKYLTRQVFL